MPDELLAISPLDGRYASEADELRAYFSEYAVIRGRVAVEVAYLAALSTDAGLVRPLTTVELAFLHQIPAKFSLADARESKDFERVTRHDVKAVESFLRARLAPTSLADIVEYLHFGLTSEDTSNIAQAIALREARDVVLVPALDQILRQLAELVALFKAAPMLGRTHGQPAVPSTFGKELAVFLSRLKRQRTRLAAHRFHAKLNGAIGNFNALVAAAPQVDWPGFSNRFVRGLGLEPESITTQVLPYDNWLEYFSVLAQINSILIGLAQDLWHYLELGYLRLKPKASETGSSTMPQKINPIDLENAEGNFGLANALFEQYARKLPISRLQRDLSDSTVRRTFGTAIGHALVGYRSLSRGLGVLDVDTEAMRQELEAHWEVVAEGAQTILRAAGLSNPYEMLKDLTRGKALTHESFVHWIDVLPVEEHVKQQLRGLSPLSYTGLAEQIAERTLQDEAATG